MSSRRAGAPAPDYEGWYADASLNEDRIAAAMRSGDWVPGANGTERPVRAQSGARLLWCWRPATGEHAYLNLDTDLVLDDAEALAHLGENGYVGGTAEVSEPRRKVMVSEVSPAAMAPRVRHLNKRRFGAGGITGARSVRWLLEEAITQRGSLAGDDRELLVAVGADKAAVAQTPARLLKVVCAGESSRGQEFVATVAIGDNPTGEGECVWDVFAGPPLHPVSSPEVEAEEVSAVDGFSAVVGNRRGQA